jgi:hypothetical protein
VATARQAEPVPPALIALVSPSGPAGGTWEGVNAIADNSIAMVNSSSNTLAGPYSYNSWNSYTDEWFAAS